MILLLDVASLVRAIALHELALSSRVGPSTAVSSTRPARGEGTSAQARPEHQSEKGSSRAVSAIENGKTDFNP